MYDYKKIDVYLKSVLKPKRYNHTQAAAEECKTLARIFALDEISSAQLYTSALLHDITKELSVEQNLDLCVKYNITLTEDDRAVPKGLHSITGAYAARDLFGADDAVFSAIYNHTFGAPQMPLVDKLLYLADYIEPTRDFPDCTEVRNAFYSQLPQVQKTSGDCPNQKLSAFLDTILLFAAGLSLKTIINEGGLIHLKTVIFRNSLCRIKL